MENAFISLASKIDITVGDSLEIDAKSLISATAQVTTNNIYDLKIN